MHAFTALIALASVASAAVLPRAVSYPGPSESGEFQLEVIALAGQVSEYSGFFLNLYHTGAALNVLTASNGQSGAQQYSFNTTNGIISAPYSSFTATLNLIGGTDFAPPKGYSFAAFDIGSSDNHFHFTTPGNYLQFGPSYADDIWSICPAEVYTAGSYVPTLLYHKPGVTLNSTCANVKIKAVF